MIPTLYEHRKWMKVLYTTAIDPFWSDYLSTFFTQWVVQNLEIDSKKLGIPKEMATELLLDGLTPSLKFGLSRRSYATQRNFAKLFLKSISTPMDQFYNTSQ